MNHAIGHVCVGEYKFSYKIIKSPRIKSGLTIKVHSNLSVSAHAPLNTSDKKIHHFVLDKIHWIHQQLAELKQQVESQPTKHHIYYFLGQPYRLQLLTEPQTIQPVKLVGDELQVIVSKNDPEIVDLLLSCWYKSHAQSQFSMRLKELAPSIHWINTLPKIRLRAMKSRWGSCSHAREITLNYHLVKAPVECIDYVIVHELCHFLEMNHGANFYRLLAGVLPDWKQRRKKLNDLAHRILPE